MMTGLSGHANNWLLLAEQMGLTVGTDCVVCLGPTPLLRVVPPPSGWNAICLSDLLTNTVPSIPCDSWDDPFPVADKNAAPPLFLMLKLL